jgi:DNA-directed RNA polymerase subunit M/transcription elongation factor TFIIS
MKYCKKCLKLLHPDKFWDSNDVCIECNQQAWNKSIEQKKKKDALLSPNARKRSLLKKAKIRAKEAGREFTITEKDIDLPEYCPILGWKLEAHTGKVTKNNYTLDRIDNEKGYVPGNVKVISWYANYVKSHLTVEEVERLLAYMKGT